MHPLAPASARFLAVAGVPGGRYKIMMTNSRRNLHTAAKNLMACGRRQKGSLVGSAWGSCAGAGSSNITGIVGLLVRDFD